MTTTAIRKVLLDGPTLTWLRRPVETGDGRVLQIFDDEGAIDGEPISDDRLRRLIGLRQ